MITDSVEKHGTSWFLDALGEVAGLTGRLIKNFVLVLIIGSIFGMLVALVMYVATSGGVVWKGSVGAAIGLIGSGVLVVVTAGNLSVVLTLSETVRAKALGQRILDKLFAEILGVTTERPQGNTELTQTMHGMPISEAEARLKTAGRTMLQERVPAAVPRIALWLMNKAQSLLVWATIRVVIAYATANKPRRDSIDLLALRASLASEVDDLLVDKIRQGAFRFVMVVVVLFLLGCWGVAEGLQKVFGL